MRGDDEAEDTTTRRDMPGRAKTMRGDDEAEAATTRSAPGISDDCPGISPAMRREEETLSDGRSITFYTFGERERRD